MKRREAVQYISLLLGGTIAGSNYFLSGCKSNTGVSMTFTQDDIAWLDEDCRHYSANNQYTRCKSC